jgi:hypothetical protein
LNETLKTDKRDDNNSIVSNGFLVESFSQANKSLASHSIGVNGPP